MEKSQSKQNPGNSVLSENKKEKAKEDHNAKSKLIQNLKKSNKLSKILTTTSFSDVIQVNKWWEQAVEDELETKWTRLEHNGVVVAPKYEPHGVKILYKGNPIDLKPFQEEIATFWAGLLNNELSTKKITRNNFLKEFRSVLDRSYDEAVLEDFDFTPIVHHIEAVRERNKNRTIEEKKVIFVLIYDFKFYFLCFIISLLLENLFLLIF